MTFAFSREDIGKISKFLFVEPMDADNSYIWQLSNKNTKESLLLTIHNDILLSNESKGSIVSIQTRQGYYELHNVNTYMIFEPDEIIFISADNYKVSSVIVGRECLCSVYANVSRDVITADFSKLDPAVLLSAMQLSLTEAILPEPEL